jgi:hypothetical protein
MATHGSLDFAEQLAFFKGKLNIPTEHWDDLLGAAHDHAFVVAGATKADLLTDLHTAVLKGIEQGTTLEEFRKDFDRLVEKHGWTGWTGEGSESGRAWRTQVIYETNLRTSYAAGRWAQIQEGKADRPYLEYRHSDSSLNPRPEHVRWDGTILPVDHPWWQTHYPPNGWGCKCRVFALSEDDLGDMGRTGPLTAPTAPDDTSGIDRGWDYPPGQEAWKKQMADKAERLPEPLKHNMLADIASTSPPRQVGAGIVNGSADAAYERIRASTTDVADIARATGFKPANIQKVKDHLFFNEQWLDRFAAQGYAPRLARFDSDAAIAAAWARLTAGHVSEQDLALLRHETAEAWYIRRHGPGYNAAHNAAEARYPTPLLPED